MKGLRIGLLGAGECHEYLMGTVGTLTAVLFDAHLNWDVFSAWLITQHLLAKITVGAVTVIDDVSIHKRPDMLEPTSANLCRPSFSQPTAQILTR